MPVRAPQENREYVAKYRVMMKADEETKKEYDKLNTSSCVKHKTAKRKN